MGKLQGARSRIKSVAVNTARANAGLINDIIDATIDQWIAGSDFEDCLASAQSQIADAALEKHGDNVRAGLARAGLELSPGPLSVLAISEAVTQKTGLDFGDLSPESVLLAVDGMIARRLSEVSGVEIDSVIGASLQDSIKAGVRAALRSGQAKKILGVVMNRRARRLATLKRLGSDEQELRKLRNRQYQAKYRRTHKLEWV